MSKPGSPGRSSVKAAGSKGRLVEATLGVGYHKVRTPTQQVRLPYRNLNKGGNLPIQTRNVQAQERADGVVHLVEVTFDSERGFDRRVVDRGRREELCPGAELVHELSHEMIWKGCALRGSIYEGGWWDVLSNGEAHIANGIHDRNLIQYRWADERADAQKIYTATRA